VSEATAVRVLVVDDEPSVLETISAILTREGYQVVAAGDVDQALSHLQDGPFDVALTDLRMEGLSGLNLLAEIRRRWPQTVAIVLTGYASLQSAVDALREGVYDYLIKPCDVEELKATVARAVERGALARALRQRLEELDVANAKLLTFNEELQRRVAEATAELSRKVDELAEAKRDLENQQRLRSEFVSMIAHELSQPLTMISGYAQLLARRNVGAETQERARSSIVSQTHRLVRLVRDLADATHLEGGSFQVYPAPNDLAEIVREQVELAQGSATDRAITFEASDGEIAVLCDRDRIAQVISNLLSNAIKYTQRGKIAVRLCAQPGQAKLQVADQGPGIPPDCLTTIFEPHVRLTSEQRSDEPKGTGLGLYIARGIVEAHGGRIWAESPGPNQGTTFTVVLPLAGDGPVPSPGGEG
jgi:signal transduction histidine kinase